MPVRLVTLGHVLCETIVFADGRREGPVLGGPTAYAGTVTARLGVPTGVVTKFGPDAPESLLDPLRDAGVDTEGVDTKRGMTTTNELVYAADGTKQLKFLKQAGPVIPADIPESYLQAAVFHAGPLDYEVPLETVQALARLGGQVSLDLGGYGGAHVRRDAYEQKKLSRSSLEELIACARVAKASDEDARLLFGDENLSEQQSAQRLVDWGAGVGVITLGARGSLVFTKDAKYAVPAIPGNALDITGGGDSYIGGFLTEYMRTGDPWRAGVFASAVALCVIERTGGVRAERMPTAEEARTRIPPDVKPQRL